jgi:hypothetical protein
MAQCLCDTKLLTMPNSGTLDPFANTVNSIMRQIARTVCLLRDY